MTETQSKPPATLLLKPHLAAAAEGFQHKLQGLLAEVAALAHQLRKTAARAHRPHDCPAGALGLLQTLDHYGPQTVPAIARMRALSRQNIQVSVNRLQARGWVTLTANPAHKRSPLVHLTDRGRERFATAIEQREQSQDALRPYISESRLVPAATLLRQLRQLLGGPELPGAPLPGERPAPQPATAPRRRAHRRQAAPATTETPPPPEPSAPEESEFPVNLL